MKPTPNGSEAVEVQEDVERGGFCFVARPDPATLVFIACCGVLSLHA